MALDCHRLLIGRIARTHFSHYPKVSTIIYYKSVHLPRPARFTHATIYSHYYITYAARSNRIGFSLFLRATRKSLFVSGIPSYRMFYGLPRGRIIIIYYTFIIRVYCWYCCSAVGRYNIKTNRRSSRPLLFPRCIICNNMCGVYI